MIIRMRIFRKQQPRQLLDTRFCETLRAIRRALLPFAVLAEVLFAGRRARQCFREEALGACRCEEEEQGATHFDATRRRRDALCCSMQSACAGCARAKRCTQDRYAAKEAVMRPRAVQIAN